MPRATTVWEIASIGSEPKRLSDGFIDVEKTLEDWVEKHPDLIEPGLTVLARQLLTDGGPLDLLCLDADARLVIVELKRADAYRVALAQVLDYAACIALLSYDELKQLVDANRQKRGDAASLDEILKKVLDEGAEEWTPDAAEPRLVLVGTGADASLRRIVDYLTAKYDLPVNGVFFDVSVTSGGGTLLVRSAVVADEQAMQQGRRRGRGGVTDDDLLAIAKDRGVEAFVPPILAAWRDATGRSGRPERRRRCWSLGTKADGRVAGAWLYPDDDAPEEKRVWLQFGKTKIAEDIGCSLLQLDGQLTAHGITIEDEEWAPVASEEDVGKIVAWVTAAYGSKAAPG
ncbi:MAG: endonuclease NucS domain-containing protein [Sandaracinaceae bacterium]